MEFLQLSVSPDALETVNAIASGMTFNHIRDRETISNFSTPTECDSKSNVLRCKRSRSKSNTLENTRGTKRPATPDQQVPSTFPPGPSLSTLISTLNVLEIPGISTSSLISPWPSEEHEASNVLEIPGPSSQTSSESIIIIMDFNDPLDFELTEDVTNEDLMEVIDQNIDYCAKIFNSNPLSQYILMDENTNKISSSSSTSEVSKLSQSNEMENVEHVFVPNLPNLDDMNLADILGVNDMDSTEPSFECYNCPYINFTSFSECKSHVDEDSCSDYLSMAFMT